MRSGEWREEWRDIDMTIHVYEVSVRTFDSYGKVFHDGSMA